MTTCNISHPMAGGGSPLLRRVDGVELPIAGTWTIPARHATIAFCVPRSPQRSDVRIGRPCEGTIDISADPDDVFIAMLFDVPGVEIIGAPVGAVGPPIVLDARSIPGPHRWTLSGELFSVAGVVPLRATLDYHGLWDRGDLSYGRFVLAGAIDHPATGRPMPFRFELLASHPDTAKQPLDETAADHEAVVADVTGPPCR